MARRASGYSPAAKMREAAGSVPAAIQMIVCTANISGSGYYGAMAIIVFDTHYETGNPKLGLGLRI